MFIRAEKGHALVDQAGRVYHVKTGNWAATLINQGVGACGLKGRCSSMHVLFVSWSPRISIIVQSKAIWSVWQPCNPTCPFVCMFSLAKSPLPDTFWAVAFKSFYSSSILSLSLQGQSKSPNLVHSLLQKHSSQQTHNFAPIYSSTVI